MLLERRLRLAFFFLSSGGVSDLKGLKRFPRGWRVGLSALEIADRPTTIPSLCLADAAAAAAATELIPFRFSSLSPFPVVTYCELLRVPRRLAEKGQALSFSFFFPFLSFSSTVFRLSVFLSTRKISDDVKNGADRQTDAARTQ